MPACFATVFSLAWSGPFVADFTTDLVLSVLWIGWRHGFSAAGLGLAFLALLGGMVFFAPCLLFALRQAQSPCQAACRPEPIELLNIDRAGIAGPIPPARAG